MVPLAYQGRGEEGTDQLKGGRGGQEVKETAEKSLLKHRKKKALFCGAFPAPGEWQKMKGQTLPREGWGLLFCL